MMHVPLLACSTSLSNKSTIIELTASITAGSNSTFSDEALTRLKMFSIASSCRSTISSESLLGQRKFTGLLLVFE